MVLGTRPGSLAVPAPGNYLAVKILASRNMSVTHLNCFFEMDSFPQRATSSTLPTSHFPPLNRNAVTPLTLYLPH